MSNNKFYELINSNKKIAIFSHIKPDADALCSSFALRNLIKNNFDFKYVDVFVDGEIGELYSPILREEVVNPERPYKSYDLAFVLDCPNLGRIGKFQEMAENTPCIVNIDHHETNSRFGNYNYVSNKVSSTCELVYLIASGQHFDMNNLIAKQLYQGIITDTNCFTSRSITPRTHLVVSELLRYKFDADAIKRYYFNNQSYAKTHLLTKALQSMRFYNEGALTTMKIDNQTFVNTGAKFEDTLGIIDNGLNIDKAEASAILIEIAENYIYCSLRSKGMVDVGKVAQSFDGGGSKYIAAFQTYGKLDEIEKTLVNTLSPIIPNNHNPDNDILF